MPKYRLDGEVNVASIGTGPAIIGAIGDEVEGSVTITGKLPRGGSVIGAVGERSRGSVTIGDDDETDSQQ